MKLGRAEYAGIVVGAFLIGGIIGVALERSHQRQVDAAINARAEEYERRNPATCHSEGDETVCRWKTKSFAELTEPQESGSKGELR